MSWLILLFYNKAIPYFPKQDVIPKLKLKDGAELTALFSTIYLGNITAHVKFEILNPWRYCNQDQLDGYCDQRSKDEENTFIKSMDG